MKCHSSLCLVSDFRGQIVSIERVQSSLDHVPHRYLLAESGDTIYTSFIGTKQYKDVIADANILQGAIFHEGNAVDDLSDIESDHAGKEKKIDENLGKPIQAKRKRLRETPKPAAHRVCVADKFTYLRETPKPALRDYVHQKGWQGYFKTYCIPEDLVPRILSPAYFHHYNTQVQQPSLHECSTYEEETSRSSFQKDKTNDGEELVLGVGPVQTSIWRLTNLAPSEAVCKHLNVSSLENYSSHSAFTTAVSEPQSLEIHEDSDGFFLLLLIQWDCCK
ncbi:uncharacterized protein LOC122021258 isoform X1 [Zingiber officinale]|uniref:uncharacterized protein LOC122021258 isoform X1 n=1 Tax=Zingiber officinale TaxID=94328 RepID=UPI001C4D8D64|nr:uncharacterized protein LOC122021258 isoform X1 [Zingiber officinale]XP_042435290.1 uncharacterized protein LOC122021258 isoform X1 [Zingiber officinale]XP_042435291.1 uncharacterized protein LOC122021258 isoform X1 [Zingiber officinale]XP_042435292.1 uncharacterized protein LOC122021258 isoform X1 [Zingiber officinale]